MNRIIVNKNNIINESDAFIDCNSIKLNNGNYIIEYNTDNIELNIVVESNIKATLFEISFDKNILVNNNYQIYGYLVVNKFYNNYNVNEKITINLLNNGSRIDYKFSNICKMEEYYTIDINHKCKNSISNISNKSIALNNSILHFIINSNVGKDMIECDLNQNTRIVTFGDSNSMICPNMNIDCNEVMAKHGSIIGTFKDEIVFYIMIRGISYNEALKLLIKGYLFSNIDAYADIRMKIKDIIDTYWG